MIVVMPDGRDSWYINNWESYMLQELIPTVEQNYRVIASPATRAMVGLSMGGWGTSYYWIKYSNMFSSAYSMSGAFGTHRPINLNNLFVNLSNSDLQALPPYAMEVGWDDHLYGLNLEWRDLLRSRGLDIGYSERAGAHTWNYWIEALPTAVQFTSANFGSTNNSCPQASMYLRGTFNSWGAKAMECDNGVWTTSATFDTNAEFKFDVYGDWSQNYGDNNGDNIAAERDGDNIAAPEGAYTVTIHGATLAYSIEGDSPGGEACSNSTMYLRGTFNGWNSQPMDCNDGVWTATVNFSTGRAFKFDVFGDWSQDYGDNNADGIASDPNGNNISAPSGTRTINFNDSDFTYTIN